MSASHSFLKLARHIHLYIGVFIAPAVLFFAFTGGLQVFSLHETSRGSDYKPPAWLMVASQLHKKQTDVMPVHKPRPAEADHRPSAAPMQVPSANPQVSASPEPAAPVRHPLPLKIFCAFVSFGLFVSTLLGLYMAYRYTRKHVLISVLLAAGTIVPVVLALI
ncbi:PepSY domain-containing protein [Dyella monticola]|uniref:PepSY domain-containing protein n=1 Tax=Dyella monticola TaxID=1927958 RepID=A0A370WYX5_9GAMM|nr:PepSY domain-containing protein [Dyella monticola]RDS81230.1 PepSY domain-containing protein [Dyella monticola]